MRLQAYRGNKIQIQPRGGRATTGFQFALLRRLALAGADILPITVDSNTRLERYEEAERLHRKAAQDGVDYLNGYPFVAIPNSEVIEMISHFPNPISLRHGSPVAHKLVNKALQCGINEIEGGPLTYLLPYSKNTPIELAIASWEAVEQACSAARSRRDEPIMRESFGVLTAVLVPPYVALLTSFLEAMFAHKNGAKHFMLGLQACGNVTQDLVQFKAAREIELIMKEDLFPDLEIYYAYHHWMGPFPKDAREANYIIDICNTAAHIVKADKVVVKTSVEAFGVPSEQANFHAVRRTAKLLKLLELGTFPWEEGNLNLEVSFLVNEVTLALSRVLSCDDINESLINAVTSGEVDLMFSPYKATKRHIECYRDDFGWIRLFNMGEMKVSEEYAKFEKRFANKVSYLSSSRIARDISWPREINQELATHAQIFASINGVDLEDD